MTTPVHQMENTPSTFTGIFINDATIVSARSVSNEDIYKNGKPVDVGIEFTLEIGKSFQPMFTVSGNFKVNGDGSITDSAATRVKIALQRLGVKWSKLNPDNSIPDDVLAQCAGKVITRLQFPYKKDETTGKTKYTTFSEFYLASIPQAKEKLEAAYHKSVAAGYVKPLADTSTEFPDPNAAQVAEDPLKGKQF